MKTSEAFKIAKRTHAEKWSDFICHCLDWEQKIPYDVAKRCKQIIMDRINAEGTWGHTLESWLLEEHNIDVFKSLSHDEKREQMYLYRQRWLASLITEFETLGD